MRAERVISWVKTFKRTGAVEDDVSKRGRPHAHQNHDEFVEKAKMLARTGMSSTQIRLQLNKEGVQISDRAIRKWLRAAGWTYRSVRATPFLDGEAMEARVRWAEKHIEENLDWKRVIFTDSKIFRGGMSPAQVKKLMAWAPKGQKKRIATKKHASYQVHVYGGISFYGATSLHIVTGTTGVQSKYKVARGKGKGQQYRGVCAAEYKDILQRGGVNCDTGLVMEASGIFGSVDIVDWVFQHDRPKIHKAAMLLLQYLCPFVLDWPSNSPDLSLIENVWARIEYHLNNEGEWTDLASFKEEIMRIWTSVTSDPEYRANLFNSMRGRLDQCIANGGDVVD
jgi:transposase